MKAVAHSFSEKVTDIKLKAAGVTKEDTLPEQNETK